MEDSKETFDETSTSTLQTPPEVGEPETTPTSEVPQQPEKKPKKAKKNIIIGLIVTMLVAGGIAGWFLLNAENDEPATQESAQVQDASETQTKSEQLYLVDSQGVVTIVNPVDGSSSSFTLGENINIGSVTVGSNQAVSFIDGTNKAVVATEKYDDSEGLAGVTETALQLYEDEKLTELVKHDATEQSIVDWVYVKEANTVYYLSGKLKSANAAGEPVTDLRKISLDDRKDVLVQADVLESSTDKTPLKAMGAAAIWYTIEDKKIVYYSSTADGVVSKQQATVTCECMFEYPQAISPDGSKLLLEEFTQSDDAQTGNFGYYIVDIQAGTLEKIDEDVPVNTQWTATYWMNNTGAVVYDTGVYGDNDTFVPEVTQLTFPELTNIEVVKGAIGDDGISVRTFGPALSGKYIAVEHDDRLKIYDVEGQQLKTTDIVVDNESVFYVAYGWVQ